MDLQQKLRYLTNQMDLVLYRWTAGRARIGNNFIPLSEVRLNAVICNQGRVTFSVSAPVLYMDRGRSVITMQDKDVLTVVDGERKGINILTKHLRDNEQAVPAKLCTCLDIESYAQPKGITNRILSLGVSPRLPVGRLLMPDVYRISRSKDAFKPIINTGLLRALKVDRNAPLSEITRMFQQNILLFGTRVDEGFVVPEDLVSSGGCCVISTQGISARTGSTVLAMPYSSFKVEAERRRWRVGEVERCVQNHNTWNKDFRSDDGDNRDS